MQLEQELELWRKTPYHEALQDAMRYRYIRVVSPRDFQRLSSINISGKGNFDDIVDAEIMELKKIKNGKL